MKAWHTWFRRNRHRHFPALVTLENGGRAGALRIHIVTDVGNVRPNNEDCAAAVYPEDKRTREEQGVMLILADGMGGHNSGEVASKMAVERVSQLFFGGKGRVLDRLRAAFRSANAEIYQAGQAEAHKGMGTTCTTVVAVGDTLYIAHVGDSRAYCLRRGQLTQLTADQTYVQYLVQKGTMDYIEAMKHPNRNMLMQALGASATVTPEVLCKQGYLAPDDVILLCSDGLYEYLSDDEMAAYLNQEATCGEASRNMVDEAKRRGGQDNITVLLGRVQPLGQETPLKATQELPQDSGPNS